MEHQDIRWQQRFSNYQKAVAQLRRFVEKEQLNELEIQGLIQAFEYTHELAWNVMKDYLQSEGYQGIMGSKSASQKAFQIGLIEDGESWARMIKDRNLSSHTYNEAVAADITTAIQKNYIHQFVAFQQKMQAIIQAAEK